MVEPPKESLMVQLVKVAHAHGGRLTVTQSVMETGASFESVEQQLKAMVKAGYVDITNDPGSGVVVYEFHELTNF
jgi:collagenase-like PrtC family protease